LTKIVHLQDRVGASICVLSKAEHSLDVVRETALRLRHEDVEMVCAVFVKAKADLVGPLRALEGHVVIPAGLGLRAKVKSLGALVDVVNSVAAVVAVWPIDGDPVSTGVKYQSHDFGIRAKKERARP